MPIEKCSLTAMPGPTVVASLNPKQFQVDKTVPWSKQVTNQNDAPALEFTHAEPKNLSVELLFDTYSEGKMSVKKAYIDKLEKMTEVVEALGHPPRVLFQWGGFQFYGAVESLSVTYTMFLDDGTPVRATANIKMKEAERLSAAGGSAGAEADPNQAVKDGGRSGMSDEQVHSPGLPLSRPS